MLSSTAARPSKVVVLGGGLAGLTFGYRVLEKGYEVDVYEARGRVGGRVQSVYIKNMDGEYSVVEMGGQNIADGGDAVNFLGLCKTFGLETTEFTAPFYRGHYEGGHMYDYQELLKGVEDDVLKLDKYYAKLEAGDTTTSLKDVMDDLHPEDTTLRRALTVLLTSYEGGDLGQISIANGLDTLKYMLLGGLAAVHRNEGEVAEIKFSSVIGGNSRLAIALAESLGERMHLNKKAVSLKGVEGGKVEVGFSDGERVVCDKVVLAMPASVYGDIQIDEGVIGKERLEKLKSVQYGKNAKIMVALDYDEGDYSSASLEDMGVFFGNDKTSLNMYFQSMESIMAPSKAYWGAIKGLKIAMPRSRFMEKEPVFVRDDNFGYYDNPTVKAWGNDEYAKGSYSFYGIDTDALFFEVKQYKGVVMKALFEPIEDKVYFIGEHTTILEEIGTMEGAVESGERASLLF